MAWTTPGTVAAGDVLTAAFWNEQVRDNLTELAPFFAAWTDYTPSISNLTQGNGTLVGRYLRIGDFITFYAKFTFGSTSSVAGTGPFGVSLPVNMRESYAGFFNSIFVDAGAGFAAVTVVPSTTNAINLYATSTSGNYALAANITNSIPFNGNWTTNDVIAVSGTYEAA